MNWATSLTLCLTAFATLALAQAPRVVITGLQGPQKLIATPGGNFLVTETNREKNAGRISFVTRTGTRRSLFEGMPSGTEVTGGGSGPTAMLLRGNLLYIAIGGGDAERRGTPPTTSMHNPEGVSSPLFSSILQAELSLPVDTIGGTFTLTPDLQNRIATGDPVTVSDGAGGSAKIMLLTKIPTSIPDPRSIYRFSNPWALELTPDGKTLYLADASQNAIYSIDSGSGRWTKIITFPPTQNPIPNGPPVIEAVPTSIRYYYGQLLVSFLTGFPFVPGNARVLAVDPEKRTATPFIYSLSSAVDVIYRERGDQRPQFYTLEFSQNQGATPPAPGRLLKYDGEAPTQVGGVLITPVSMVFDERENLIYVLELRGQIVEIRP